MAIDGGLTIGEVYDSLGNVRREYQRFASSALINSEIPEFKRLMDEVYELAFKEYLIISASCILIEKNIKNAKSKEEKSELESVLEKTIENKKERANDLFNFEDKMNIILKLNNPEES